jgi:sigma-B regulation protein RsbU (phosphoserine phosphatase)
MIGPGAKILVVDDIAENRDLLLRRLQRLGITDVDQAANGREALSALDERQYDLMLLDMMMPEVDGFAVLDTLKKDGRVNDLPIIVISAMNEMDAVIRCIESGAEDFLFKPFNPVMLKARVLSSLEKKFLRDKTRDELKRKQAELNEARGLQLALVPPPFAEQNSDLSLTLDLFLEPAKEVGGDLVDYFRFGDLVSFLVGDVSDKGAGAALMMARTHAMFRALSGRPDGPALFAEPAKACSIVNASLAAGNASCMFVTLLLATLDLKTRTLTYVRAGHVPPFVFSEADGVRRLTSAGGPPLGLVEGFAYKQDETVLAPDESVLTITDGFSEAATVAHELYGEERIAAALANTAGNGDTLTALIAAVRAFEAGAPQADDMAAVLMRPLA